MAKSKLTSKKAKQYLEDSLSNTERYDLERSVMNDGFEAEALEGFETLSGAELRQDLKKLQDSLEKRKQPKRKVFFLPQFKIAASLLLLIGLGSIIYIVFPEKKNIYELVDTEIYTETDSIPNSIVYTPEVIMDNEKQSPTFDKKKVEEEIEAIIQNTEPVAVQEAPTSIISSKSISVNEDEEANYESESKVSETIAKPKLERTESIKAKASNIYKQEARKNRYTPNAIANEKPITADTVVAEVETIETEEPIYIKGTVFDESGVPLPGVNILLKGKRVGAVSDFDGDYSIKAKKGDTLLISYTGMKDKEIILEEAENLKTILEFDESVLSEVVVIGYGVQKKKEITGAVSTIITATSATPPQGSKENFKEWVYNQLDKIDAIESFEAKITLKINRRGKVDIVIFKSDLSTNIQQKLEQILLSSKKWIPAIRNGKKVSEELSLNLEY